MTKKLKAETTTASVFVVSTTSLQCTSHLYVFFECEYKGRWDTNPTLLLTLFWLAPRERIAFDEHSPYANVLAGPNPNPGPNRRSACPLTGGLHSNPVQPRPLGAERHKTHDHREPGG